MADQFTAGLPTPDEWGALGSPEHRMWFFARRVICGELVHACGLIPPRLCVPCQRTKGHIYGSCRIEWVYEDEYPEMRENEFDYQRRRRAKDRFQVTRDPLDASEAP